MSRTWQIKLPKPVKRALLSLWLPFSNRPPSPLGSMTVEPAAAHQAKWCRGPRSKQIKPRGRDGGCFHKWWGSAVPPFLGGFMRRVHAREHGELVSQKQMLLIPTQEPPHSPVSPDTACQMATAKPTAEQISALGSTHTSVGLVKDPRCYGRASNTHEQQKCLGCGRHCAKHFAGINSADTVFSGRWCGSYAHLL